MSDGYGVGYRRPPKHTLFKPGRSGNPKGRPKDRKNMRTIVKDILDRKVVITENGRERRVDFMEAFVQQLIAKALKGTARDQITIFNALQDHAPELVSEPETREVIFHYVKAKDGRPYYQEGTEVWEDVGGPSDQETEDPEDEYDFLR